MLGAPHGDSRHKAFSKKGSIGPVGSRAKTTRRVWGLGRPTRTFVMSKILYTEHWSPLEHHIGDHAQDLGPPSWGNSAGSSDDEIGLHKD